MLLNGLHLASIVTMVLHIIYTLFCSVYHMCYISALYFQLVVVD